MKKSLILLVCLALAGCTTPEPASTPLPAAKDTVKTPTAQAGPPPIPMLTLISSNPPVPSVTLGWPQSTDEEVGSYMLYWGTNSGTYTSSTNVPGITNVTATIGPLAYSTTYYFVATAKAGTAESRYSAEVPYTTEDAPVINTNVDFIIQLQTASAINGPFKNEGAPIYMNSSYPQAFFRLQITTITN